VPGLVRRLIVPGLLLFGFAGVAAHADPIPRIDSFQNGEPAVIGAHAIAMHGEPKYPPDFSHFDYVNPDAPKGGTIRLGVEGSFDSFNPFVARGSAAAGASMPFESLLTSSDDEPFTMYGLIAESIEYPPDRSWIKFNLRPEARWHDGEPITPEDVIFTYEVFAEKGRPPFSARMSRIETLEKTGPHSVRFTFNEDADREFPLIVALTPIVPKHFFDFETFDRTTLRPVVGSGAYRIARVQPGERIVFERNPDYWGRDLPSRRGFDNYDRITIEYFLSANARFEAFKRGLCSVHIETDPVTREREYDFPALTRGEVVIESFTNGIPPVVTGFLFNTRLPKFADPALRRALSLLYDFSWVNENIYGGALERTASFWQGSELSALGRPASARERELLAPYPEAVLPEVMDGTWRPTEADGSGRDRTVLRAAMDMLQDAGYRVENGALHDPDGRPLSFEILTASQSEERLATVWQRALARLGIDASIRLIDDSQMQHRKQRFEFEVIIGSTGFSGSLSPGTELINRWGSASRDVEGSFNLAGAADPAIDAMIEAMLSATSREDYVAAVRALDRILISSAYIVPMQHHTEEWVAYRSELSHPGHTPLYGFQLQTWWHEQAD
jgi:peptide/nickel transport system substrate-binding protein